MKSNLATVNLSDFSHSLLICSIKSLEIFLLLEILCTCLGHTVWCLQVALDYCLVHSFNWVAYHTFSLPVSYHILLSCEHTDYLPNVNMCILYS